MTYRRHSSPFSPGGNKYSRILIAIKKIVYSSKYQYVYMFCNKIYLILSGEIKKTQQVTWQCGDGVVLVWHFDIINTFILNMYTQKMCLYKPARPAIPIYGPERPSIKLRGCGFANKSIHCIEMFLSICIIIINIIVLLLSKGFRTIQKGFPPTTLLNHF